MKERRRNLKAVGVSEDFCLCRQVSFLIEIQSHFFHFGFPGQSFRNLEGSIIAKMR